VLEEFTGTISRGRPQCREKGSLFLLHDNVPARSAVGGAALLTNRGVVEVVTHLIY